MSTGTDKTLLWNTISKQLRNLAEVKSVVERVSRMSLPMEVAGPKGGFVGYLLARLHRETEKTILAVTPNESEAQALTGDLEQMGVQAFPLPWLGAAAYGEPGSDSQAVGLRMHALAAMLDEERTVFVASLRAIATYLPPVERFRKTIFHLTVGDSFDPQNVARKLTDAGYWRVPRVGVHGEYALRGEVLDISQPGDELAIRLVFDFDRLAEIRLFELGSQHSVEQKQEIAIHPVHEVIWSDQEREHLRRQVESSPEFQHTRTEAVRIVGDIDSTVPGTYWNGLAYEHPGTIADFLPITAAVVWVDQERLESAYHTLLEEYQGVFTQQHFVRPLPKPERVVPRLQELMTATRQRSVHISSLIDGDNPSVHRIQCDPPRSYFGNVSYLKEELTNLASSGFTVVVCADTEKQRARVEHLVRDYDVSVLVSRLSGGFAVPNAKLAVIQENEIFGRRRRAPASVKRVESSPIDTFVELNEGDYVVHLNHGIGLYRGIRRMVAAGNERDYIHVEYSGGESIYVPIEQVNLVQRYIGSGGAPPRLDRIGGKSWEKRKASVRKNVEDLADRLIKLYSKRKKASGYAYPADTEWQLEFEAAFPYEETPDQLRCIGEIKTDMERPLPMDRLICGDVGYGKTEVALRAIFKAVTAGKQVAFLAPTTILAEQHFELMLERFGEYPVQAGMLSRLVPKKQQRDVIKGLKAGDYDVVVGTHRLLQKDVEFANLGLLVVDEEQRFGVKAKERLKELKTSVDSLTLTATPIPRTLHMSMLKIRDMSLLTTPPQNRHPIKTYVEEFNADTVGRAIKKEIDRDGQVFFLHNRIETLDDVRRFIENLVPEVSVGVAHGQMDATDLEDIMHRFVHGAFQVLVATTIIENGIDIPNVNTIIIDRADMYGVSQLYQLRGRVGRSDRVAYAYLFYPEDRALPELALKRLQIISDFTDLGSGFKIALKDLEVRGAGNLLGRQQSGEIGAVGFDLYLRLLDEAIRDLEAEPSEGPEEVYLELDYSGFIPSDYIPEMATKMEVYKKIAAVGEEEQLNSLIAEIEDRFGPIPEAVQSLLALSELRILGRRLHVTSMKERSGTLRVEFGKVAAISVDRVLALIKNSGGSVKLDPNSPNVLVLNTQQVGLREKSEFIRDRLSQLL